MKAAKYHARHNAQFILLFFSIQTCTFYNDKSGMEDYFFRNLSESLTSNTSISQSPPKNIAGKYVNLM